MDQIKKDQRDPDFDKLNPDIIRIAETNGFVRQPLELFLTGKLTWHEALETMVVVLYREFKDHQTLLKDVLTERPAIALLLSVDSGPLLKALPRHPYPYEETTNESVQVSDSQGDIPCP